MFGLHANADLGYLTENVKAVWRSLVDMQPRTGEGVHVDWAGLASGIVFAQ